MSGSDKIRVGVIFGGRSGEHEVSLRSAQAIMHGLNRDKYEVVPLGITKEGHWVAGDPMAVLTANAEARMESRAVMLPPIPGHQQIVDSRYPEKGMTLDVMFPVLHGTFGEDGTIQGLLELANVPYVGAGVVGSAVGMDKGIFKRVMAAHNIPVLPWVLIQGARVKDDLQAAVADIEAKLPYPVFTKPANLGSSVGISKCSNRQELIGGLREAAAFDRRIVVEQGIDARELEVAVLGNEYPRASVVGEIRPKRDFYDYEAKYISDDSELLIPAPLSEEVSDRIRQLAVAAYQAIDCAGLGRVDFLLDRHNEQIFINEINTLPGFTVISMYPKLWEASGLSFGELLDQLIGFALERFEQRTALTTDFQQVRIS